MLLFLKKQQITALAASLIPKRIKNASLVSTDVKPFFMLGGGNLIRIILFLLTFSIMSSTAEAIPTFTKVWEYNKNIGRSRPHFSPDGTKVYYRQDDNWIILDTKSGEFIHSVPATTNKIGKFSYDGKHFATLGGRAIYIYETDTYTLTDSILTEMYYFKHPEEEELDSLLENFVTMCYSPDDSLMYIIVECYTWYYEDHTMTWYPAHHRELKVVDLASKKVLHRKAFGKKYKGCIVGYCSGGTDQIYVTPDGNYLILGRMHGNPNPEPHNDEQNPLRYFYRILDAHSYETVSDYYHLATSGYTDADWKDGEQDIEEPTLMKVCNDNILCFGTQREVKLYDISLRKEIARCDNYQEFPYTFGWFSIFNNHHNLIRIMPDSIVSLNVMNCQINSTPISALLLDTIAYYNIESYNDTYYLYNLYPSKHMALYRYDSNDHINEDFTVYIPAVLTEDILKINLSLYTLESLRISLLDNLGNELCIIKDEDFSNDTAIEYNMKSFASGTYFIQINDKTYKFVKAR